MSGLPALDLTKALRLPGQRLRGALLFTAGGSREAVEERLLPGLLGSSGREEQEEALAEAEVVVLTADRAAFGGKTLGGYGLYEVPGLKAEVGLFVFEQAVVFTAGRLPGGLGLVLSDQKLPGAWGRRDLTPALATLEKVIGQRLPAAAARRRAERVLWLARAVQARDRQNRLLRRDLDLLCPAGQSSLAAQLADRLEPGERITAIHLLASAYGGAFPRLVERAGRPGFSRNLRLEIFLPRRRRPDGRTIHAPFPRQQVRRLISRGAAIKLWSLERWLTAGAAILCRTGRRWLLLAGLSAFGAEELFAARGLELAFLLELPPGSKRVRWSLLEPLRRQSLPLELAAFSCERRPAAARDRGQAFFLLDAAWRPGTGELVLELDPKLTPARWALYRPGPRGGRKLAGSRRRPGAKTLKVRLPDGVPPVLELRRGRQRWPVPVNVEPTGLAGDPLAWLEEREAALAGPRPPADLDADRAAFAAFLELLARLEYRLPGATPWALAEFLEGPRGLIALARQVTANRLAGRGRPAAGVYLLGELAHLLARLAGRGAPPVLKAALAELRDRCLGPLVARGGWDSTLVRDHYLRELQRRIGRIDDAAGLD